MKKASRFRARMRVCWRQHLRPILIMAIVLFSIRSVLADWNDVPTGSMKPTILEGDRVFVNKLAYDLKVPFTTWHLAEWSEPARGDIVVFYSPHDGQRLVKRVIGLPGDTVELHNNRLYVNGEVVANEELSETISSQLPAAELPQHFFAAEQLPGHPHAVMTTPQLPALRSFASVTVPAGRYFMMGDNRDNSFDSRYFGTVPRASIVGRATSVVMSLNRTDKWQPRWSRFFKPLDPAEPTH